MYDLWKLGIGHSLEDWLVSYPDRFFSFLIVGGEKKVWCNSDTFFVLAFLHIL